MQINISGTVSSTAYTILNNLPFKWIIYNNDEMIFAVSSPTSTLPSLTLTPTNFSTDLTFDTSLPQQFTASTSAASYAPR